MNEPGAVHSVDEVLAAARARLDRVHPTDLESERIDGALIVDVRPTEQRIRDGELPGAVIIDRNVLEWRLDPACEHRLAPISSYGTRIVIVCNEGYSSSLAHKRAMPHFIDETDSVSYYPRMPRTTPPDRRAKLLDAAAAAFVEHGFQRTQMDDIAERLGVSKGTIYRTFDSKDAVFAAVIAWADGPDDTLPTAESAPSDIAALATSITTELTTAIAALELTAIVAGRRRLRSTASVADEIERLAVALHRVMHARRTAVMVLDRCAGEIPQLSNIWFGDGRYALVDLWADYLELRAAVITTEVDRAILARTIVEIITTWAVKMPWDLAPRPYPDDTASACGTMIRHLVAGGTK